ncbi:PQQ-binding-like beta-propeller repeat protein [Anaerolineales bacterium HSG25]|nr:PQQ-binding-like beta-propeller repeat protein [Anaerolineales bacterium HSG25]
MPQPTIICPQCLTPLHTDSCSNCGWHNSPQTGQIGQIAWQVSLNQRLPKGGCRLVTWQNMLYLHTEQTVIGLNTTTRAETWRYQVEPSHQIHSLLVWRDWLLVVLNDAGNDLLNQKPAMLLALSTKTGVVQWQIELDGSALSEPTIHADVAYLTSDTNKLYSIDGSADIGSAGRLPATAPHSIPLSPDWSWGPGAPVISNTGLIIPTCRTNQLMAFELNSGKLVWRFSAGNWFPHAPLVAENTLYIRCWDKHVYALDITTGQPRWHYKAPRDISADLCLHGNYLYVGVKDYEPNRQRAYALHTLNRHSGELLNRHAVVGTITARPIATKTGVWVATQLHTRKVASQGNLYQFDPTGQKSLQPPQTIPERFQSDLLLTDSWLLAGTRSGTFYAVYWPSAKTVAPPQPKTAHPMPSVKKLVLADQCPSCQHALTGLWQRYPRGQYCPHCGVGCLV